jgi:hypothetical protein
LNGKKEARGNFVILSPRLISLLFAIRRIAPEAQRLLGAGFLALDRQNGDFLIE